MPGARPRCRALNEVVCAKGTCPFFTAPEAAARAKERTQARLVALGFVPPPTEQLESYKGRKVGYTIYDRASGALIVQGSCQACAEALGRTKKGLHHLIYRAMRSSTHRYVIEKQEA